MRNDACFLCSELVRLCAPGSAHIGNLEQISRTGCTVFLDDPLPIGTRVWMRCVECPQGKKSCTECRFRGRVEGCDVDPVLGCFVEVEFDGRAWVATEWHPRHLTGIAMPRDGSSS